MFNEDNHDKRKYVNLTDSEAAVLAVSSRIFSDYITQGKVDEDSEKNIWRLLLSKRLKWLKKTAEYHSPES